MAENEQACVNDRRAPLFTAENAAVCGANGGKASGKARREKRAMRDAICMLLDRKLVDADTVKRLRDAGYITSKGKPTVRLAVAANLVEIAMSPAPSTTAGTAVRAVVALAQIESGEIGTPPPSLREDMDEGVGGVVILPEQDERLIGSWAESQTSAEGDGI